MAMSAKVSDVPPVEVDEDTVTWVLCDVVVAPTLIVVVPLVAVGPLVVGQPHHVTLRHGTPLLSGTI